MHRSLIDQAERFFYYMAYQLVCQLSPFLPLFIRQMNSMDLKKPIAPSRS